MDIYFAGSIAGGRSLLGTYRRVIDWLKAKGHRVLTEHVGDPEVLGKEKLIGEKGVYERDVELLRKSDVLIAEVTTPSLGVGYEVCYALQLGKPVLCVYRAGTFVSRMITGNTSPNIVVRAYADEHELFRILDTFLDSGADAG